jgi:hypothetical protein
MTDDLVRDLSRIQDDAVGLAKLITIAQLAAPATATATDSHGMIRATLGPDGLPKSLVVDQRWQRRVASQRFGATVVEAFQAAMGERLKVWSATLEERGWRARFDELRAAPDHHSRTGATSGVPPAFRRPQPKPGPRPIDAVAEDVIRLFDRVDDIGAARQRTITGTGHDRSRKLTLTLSAHGLVSCVADPQWVSAQTATALTNGLGEALAAARADLARTDGQAATHYSSDLTDLFSEALALLSDPQRTRES